MRIFSQTFGNSEGEFLNGPNSLFVFMEYKYLNPSPENREKCRRVYRYISREPKVSELAKKNTLLQEQLGADAVRKRRNRLSIPRLS